MKRTLAATAVLVSAVSLSTVTSSAAAPLGSEASAAGRCSAAVSLTGFSDHLDETTFGGQPVAGLSALAPALDGSLLALSDRSELFTLDAATRTPTAVVALRDEAGAELDSEGLVVDRDGTLLVSSEVGPAVRRYSPDGRILGSLPVPAALQIAPAGRAQTNLSLEGLTLSADGLTLYSNDEQELLGDPDGALRIQTWHRTDLAAPFELGPQIAYQADPGLGVPELVAAPDGRIVLIEREFIEQVGNTVRLYVIDPAAATDVSAVEVLEEESVVAKTLLADLVTCPAQGAVAEQEQLNPLLDNIEGMTVLSAQGDRRLQLLLVSDDNERPTQTTRFYDLDVTLPIEES
ncbi:esterase-like activity of phytase family protein [Kineococcus arenarius]|uniref:esterase-like activity of phytase family protein n=1 Tax=unclassified Kineococcus TaxID=2621656 RepID=UPI003D7D5A18